MARFFARRVLQSILTVLGVITAAFFLIRLAGDPALLLLPVEATDEDLARIRAAMGLDRPLVVQYLAFLGDALRGDFGESVRQKTSAMGLVLERVPATLELALTSFCVGIGLAFTLGVLMRMTTARWGWTKLGSTSMTQVGQKTVWGMSLALRRPSACIFTSTTSNQRFSSWTEVPDT